jgi:Reverse transcriptase (RNA-dependent DNA polymerase)
LSPYGEVIRDTLYPSVRPSLTGFTCSLKDINSGMPQGSPVSSILFNIYLSGIFDRIEEQNPEIRVLSFINDITFLAPGKIVKDIQDTLTNAGEQAIA